MLLGAYAAAAPPPVPSAIFRNGDDGFGSYRIPVLLVVSPGSGADRETVLAFGEGFPTGAASDHIRHIVMRRSTDSGRTFGPIAPNITDSSSVKGARWGGTWTSVSPETMIHMSRSFLSDGPFPPAEPRAGAGRR